MFSSKCWSHIISVAIFCMFSFASFNSWADNPLPKFIPCVGSLVTACEHFNATECDQKYISKISVKKEGPSLMLIALHLYPLEKPILVYMQCTFNKTDSRCEPVIENLAYLKKNNKIFCQGPSNK